MLYICSNYNTHVQTTLDTYVCPNLSVFSCKLSNHPSPYAKYNGSNFSGMLQIRTQTVKKTIKFR